MHQIMKQINMVELETSGNQLGFFWNNENHRSSRFELSLHFCYLKGCNFLIG